MNRRSMRTVTLLGGVAMLGLLAGVFSSGASGEVGLKEGDIVPDLTLTGSDGKKHSLRDAMKEGNGLIVAWVPKTFTPG